VLGLDVTRRRTGATFLSSGEYHHHVAVNVWHSNDAGIRDGKRAGLDWFAMEINDQPTIDGVKKGLNAAGGALQEFERKAWNRLIGYLIKLPPLPSDD
jgi:catechol 2,3-dioxygenase